MPGLPQILQEDIQVIQAALEEFLRRSESTAAIVVDKGGPIICQVGNAQIFDTTTIAALAAGSFCANQAMAERVGEANFNCVYQQGEQSSLLVSNIDENLLMIVIFRAVIGVGAVKHFAFNVVKQVAAQIEVAQKRAPGNTIDLVSLNTMDAYDLFQRNISAQS